MWKRKRRARSTPTTVRALRFEVIDVDGKVRAVLGDTGQTRPGTHAMGLELLDVDGQPRLAVVLTEFGPRVSVAAAGNVTATFGHDDPHPEIVGSGAFLQLMAPDGTSVALWRVDADGSIHEHLRQ
jgi:hypothetical protein